MSNILDVKRGTLQKAENPPGSETPLQFDLYTLNHAAFVGMDEVQYGVAVREDCHDGIPGLLDD